MQRTVGSQVPKRNWCQFVILNKVDNLEKEIDYLWNLPKPEILEVLDS